MTHVLSHLRRNVVAYVALAVAIGAGGGYAVAATSGKTITVCADKKTGVLHLDARGRRCGRGQSRVSWNQQGPPGVQGPSGSQGPQGTAGATGAQGPQGAQGPAAISVWAQVANNGVVVFGQGISVQYASFGTYNVTITDPTCARRSNAPVVSVSGPAEPSGGPVPVAWYGSTGANQQFTVFTGTITAGSFSPADHTFDVIDTCQ